MNEIITTTINQLWIYKELISGFQFHNKKNKKSGRKVKTLFIVKTLIVRKISILQ